MFPDTSLRVRDSTFLCLSLLLHGRLELMSVTHLSEGAAHSILVSNLIEEGLLFLWPRHLLHWHLHTYCTPDNAVPGLQLRGRHGLCLRLAAQEGSSLKSRTREKREPGTGVSWEGGSAGKLLAEQA